MANRYRGAVESTSARVGVLDRVATALLALETVLMAAVTALYGSYAVLDQGGERFLWGATVVSALLTVGIGVVTWGFWTRRRFSHGAAFAWQLLQGAAGVWLVGTMPWLGAALIVAAIVVAVAVMRRIASMPRLSEED
jgi:hypothetical protein